MDITEKIERSKQSQKIDFSQISCIDSPEPMQPILQSDSINVEPIWTIETSIEGELYRDYIKEHPSYTHIYVRNEVKQRLIQAASLLKPRFTLIVRAGHRPVEVQDMLLKKYAQQYKQEHPIVSEGNALAHARTYVSDPSIMPPPHCCGAAVDVELRHTKTGELVDFGSPINLDKEVSYLHYDGTAIEQKENRMILLNAMLNAGFASNPAEWWHYSYGDQRWAWFYGKSQSLYDIANSELFEKTR